MSRKRKGNGSGRAPKGQPTPKNTPASMSRGRHQRIAARRFVERVSKERDVVTADEQTALEILMREAGGIILEGPEGRPAS